MKKNKKILIAAGNYWTSPYHVGSHQFAKLFTSKGWQVLFVSDPISPFHFLMRNNREEVLERYRIHKNKVNSGYKDLRIYVPMTLFTPNEKPLFKTYFVAKYWHNLTIPNLGGYVKRIGFDKVDLLWFDSVAQYFWINKIEYKKSILRVADKSAFRKDTLAIKKLEKELLDKVDNIIYAAKSMKAYLNEYEYKLLYIPNGVNIEHFLKSDRTMPKDFRDIPKPIAIYVGAISDWFGIDFLLEVAQKYKDLSFVLIGKAKIDISKLHKQPNIYYLGKRDYSEIPRYMYNSDIGIITFDVQHPGVESINPLKLYEYMTCRLPVVATKWRELELINSPAYLAKDPDDFINGLKKAIQEKDRDKYLQFAKNNTWEERYKKLNKICLNSKQSI